MEEVIKKLQTEFSKETYKRENKLAFAIGYLEDNSNVNRKEAMQIIGKIFFEEL